jgi:hypothetical protein
LGVVALICLAFAALIAFVQERLRQGTETLYHRTYPTYDPPGDFPVVIPDNVG